MIFYQDLPPDKKEKAFLIPDKNFIYHINQLWDQWEKIQHRFPISKKFLLIKKERPVEMIEYLGTNIEKIIDVIFVDVFQTALILQKHYDLFRRAVGFDFDPLQTVFELEDKDSEFWMKINSCKYSHLWGLLYGFGEKNAWGYVWKGRHIIGENTHEKEIDFAHALNRWSSNRVFPQVHDKNVFSISNFPLPFFTSFSQTDPVIIQYEKERKMIQKMYRGQDFVQFTLHLLSD